MQKMHERLFGDLENVKAYYARMQARASWGEARVFNVMPDMRELVRELMDRSAVTERLISPTVRRASNTMIEMVTMRAKPLD